MQDDTGEGFVGNGERRVFAVSYGEIMGRGVALELLGALDFHGVVIPCVQLRVYPALFVCGDGFHQALVRHAADFKGDVGDALGLVRLVDLDDFHTAGGGVVEGQNLGFTRFDFNALGCGIQYKSLQALGLLGGNDGSGLQASEGNTAVFISLIDAIIGTNKGTAAVDYQELYASQRPVFGACHQFLNGQSLAGDVVKRDGLCVRRIHCNSLRLGGGVDGVSREGPGFLDYYRPCDAGNADFSSRIRRIQALGGQVAVGRVHIAAFRVGQLKFHPR